MKVLIVEDEQPALENLTMCIKDTGRDIHIAGTTASVAQTVRWLQQHEAPDLMLVDIELADGLAFYIFREHNVTCPVIFTTSYNKYLTQAFEYNSIDYLLKPVDLNKLSNTLIKYQNLKQHFVNNYLPLLETIQLSPKYKSRIIVKKGTEFQSIKLEDVVYFFSEFKLAFLVDKEGKKYLCEVSSLSEIEKMLDPEVFFRVNRKYIINADYIIKFRSTDKSRISVEMMIAAHEEIVISQENAPVFKEWISKL